MRHHRTSSPERPSPQRSASVPGLILARESASSGSMLRSRIGSTTNAGSGRNPRITGLRPAVRLRARGRMTPPRRPPLPALRTCTPPTDEHDVRAVLTKAPATSDAYCGTVDVVQNPSFEHHPDDPWSRRPLKWRAWWNQSLWELSPSCCRASCGERPASQLTTRRTVPARSLSELGRWASVGCCCLR